MRLLRRRMIEDMQIRNLTPNTQRAYVAINGADISLGVHRRSNCAPRRQAKNALH